jgi:NTP pyrophosphatase (non-canonical NTP hydrolase)
MRIFKLAQEAYQIALDHGWHDKKRSYDEILALILTEAGEAIDEDRKGNPAGMHYIGKNGKPEGVGIELADLVIRIMDAAGELEAIEDLTAGYKTAEKYPGTAVELTSLVMDVADVISEARYCFQTLRNAHNAANTLGWAVSFIDEWCDGHGIKLDAMVKQKMAYNRTRSIRHGKAY